MIDWHIIGILLILLLFMCVAIFYENHLYAKINQQLTRLEKLVHEQENVND